ncbi:MAG: DinB family protein [Hymenobacter sp.]|nr:DinB family protein [Hymenobacter sp.]
MKIEELIVEIDQMLAAAFAELDGWCAAPASVRSYRPLRGGWTVGEILEHVALTNHYLLILIEKGTAKALKKPAADVAAELTNYTFERAKLDEVGRHKALAFERPEHMAPKGVRTAAEVRAALQQQQRQCQQVLRRLPNGEGVLCRTMMSVNELGKIDVYAFVYFLAKHVERHVTQMEKTVAEQR